MVADGFTAVYQMEFEGKNSGSQKPVGKAKKG